jgi:diguanylate cyclase (GGDEF)-like protein
LSPEFVAPVTRSQDPSAGDPWLEVLVGGSVLLLVAAAPFVVLAGSWLLILGVVLGLLAMAGVVAQLYDEARWPRLAWERLSRLTVELVGHRDESSLVEAALSGAAELLRCDEVALLRDPVPPGARSLLTRCGSRVGDRVETVQVGRATANTRRADADLVVPLAGGFGVLLVSGGTATGRRTRRDLAAALAHLLTASIAAVRAHEAECSVVRGPDQGSLRDELSGLGTRALLMELGGRRLATSVTHHRHAAVLLIDLDDFKGVNDSLGHAVGDQVLGVIGRRLRAALRETDIAVRLGGDEFAVLAGDLQVVGDIPVLAERLLAAIRAPLHLDDVVLTVRASVGVAAHLQDGQEMTDLLSAADRAMYQAKAGGGDRWCSSSDVSSRATAVAPRVLQDLHRGIPGTELVVHYEPQVDAVSGTVAGFEAMVRWSHPEHGLVPPGVFLAEAEERGMLRDLAEQMLQRALADLAALRALAPGATMSVKVSPRRLMSPRLTADVALALDRLRRAGHELTIEIAQQGPRRSTETGAVLGNLAALGCGISVHGFGAGVSSLRALCEYPGLAEIKLDPELACRVPVDTAAQRMVRATVTAAHGLGVRIVAEGVDSAAVGAALAAIGCDRLQGPAIHEPAPLEAILPWLDGFVPPPEVHPEASRAAPVRPIPPTSGPAVQRSHP